MRQETIDGIFRHVHKLGGVETTEILKYAPGHAVLGFNVTPDSFNIHGTLHGGMIFTLCDIASAIATYGYEVTNVTQNSSIQYLKKVCAGRVLIEAVTLHKSSRTAVNQVTIKSEAGVLLVTASFTMFLLAPLYP